MKLLPYILGILIALAFIVLTFAETMGPHPGTEQTLLFLELGKPHAVTFTENEKEILKSYYTLSFESKPRMFKMLLGLSSILIGFCLYGIFRESKFKNK